MPRVSPAPRSCSPTEASAALQDYKLALMRKLDRGVASRFGRLDALESAIGNYELAYRMQSAVPELMALDGETPATRELYGLNAKVAQTQTFGAQHLLARRLVERGVRFIELTFRFSGRDIRLTDVHGEVVKEILA